MSVFFFGCIFGLLSLFVCTFLEFQAAWPVTLSTLNGWTVSIKTRVFRLSSMLSCYDSCVSGSHLADWEIITIIIKHIQTLINKKHSFFPFASMRLVLLILYSELSCFHHRTGVSYIAGTSNGRGKNWSIVDLYKSNTW